MEERREHKRARHAGEVGGEWAEEAEAMAMPVTGELARVQARFGLDPAASPRSLADAWMAPTGTMEEDEAEFLDAVADCISAGLSLEAALASWGSGSLATADADEELDDADDEAFNGAPILAAGGHATPLTGRRLLVR